MDSRNTLLLKIIKTLELPWRANAGETGSIPGPGRSHMPWSNQACVLRSLHAASKISSAAAKTQCNQTKKLLLKVLWVLLPLEVFVHAWLKF